MSLASWRIVKPRYAATAFDGEGAAIDGGRWNSPGTRMVYTSQSGALATLELLVHLWRGPLLNAYVLVPCMFDKSLVLQLDRERLPKDWRSYPAPPALQAIGDAWIMSGASAVLAVPSALIDTEENFLLNPRHPDFKEIRIREPRPFELDQRLLRP